VTPQIATPTQSAMQTTSAVTVTAKAVTGNATEVAPEVIASKAIISATATMTAVAGKCASGKSEIPENNDDCKNDGGFAQH
jgi:hypothetical protein